MSKINWNKIVLQEVDNVHLSEDIILKPVQMFGGNGSTNVVFDIIPTHKCYTDAFVNAGRAMMFLRNDDAVKEVFLTLEAHNKKYISNDSHTGLNHFLCQIRVELEGSGL